MTKKREKISLEHKNTQKKFRKKSLQTSELPLRRSAPACGLGVSITGSGCLGFTSAPKQKRSEPKTSPFWVSFFEKISSKWECLNVLKTKVRRRETSLSLHVQNISDLFLEFLEKREVDGLTERYFRCSQETSLGCTFGVCGVGGGFGNGLVGSWTTKDPFVWSMTCSFRFEKIHFRTKG